MSNKEGPADGADLTLMYRHRFSDAERQAMTKVWRVLIDHFFQKWIGPEDAVLDVGAGLCNFINQIDAGRKVAADADTSVGERCAAGVSFVECGCEALGEADLGGKFDVVFVSNLLEHLANGDAVLALLASIRGHMNPGSRLIILQPNFALVGASYFDFIDHKTILTDKSLSEALALSGFDIIYLKRRFLPYTSKSSIPKAPWLVRLYLMLPIAQYFFGKQTLVVARPTP